MLRTSCLLAVLAAPAYASCPDPNRTPEAVFDATGADLLMPQTFDVVAGGGNPVPCTDFVEADPALLREELVGFMTGQPTAVFNLSGMGPHIMTVTARADCGPVLAVNTADGFWFFGEFSDIGQEVTIWGVPDGPVSVWLGATTLAGCDGSVTLETFDR